MSDMTPANAIEATRDLMFPAGKSVLVIRPSDDTEQLVASAEGALLFLDGHPGQVCLQTFGPDGKPLAYTGLAAVLEADHCRSPSCILERARDGRRVGIWRLETPIEITDTKSLEALEDIARGLGNEGVADPAPIPGTDGWTIAEIQPDRVYSLEAMKLAPARLYGELDPELLARELNLSVSPYGMKTKDRHWQPWKPTVAELIERLARHTQGKKDGYSILQGVALGGSRTKNAMERLCLLGLDLDTGESLSSLRQRIQAEGWLAIIWSTHSHLKPISDPLRDQVMRHVGVTDRDPTIEEGVRYLREVKRIQEWVLDGAKLRGFKHEVGGNKMLIEHKPIPKYRILFVLREPFEPARRGGTHAAGLEEWEERYAGVSERIGAVCDRSCLDVSRLFFTARHSSDAKEWHLEVIAGAALDLDKIERVKKARRSGDDAFSEAAARLGGGDEYKTANLKRFAALYAGKFEADDFLMEVDPQGDRGSRSGPGRHHQCPGDADHSDAGNSEDRGHFVINASESDTGGFVMSCRHDACSRRDRLALLDLVCEEVGIADAMEGLRKWVPETIEDDGEPKEPPAAKPKQTKATDRDAEAAFQSFGDEWAYVAEGPSGRFVKFLPDGNPEFRGIEALDKRYAHKPIVMLDSQGKPKLKSLVKEWLRWPDSDSRKFDGLRFAPGKKDDEIRPYLNTWRGLGIVPKQGSWARMRTHIEEVLAKGSEKDALRVIGSLAHLLQNLGDVRKKLTTVLVVRGVQGAGKSVVFDYFRAILGRHGIALSKPEQIVGRFNSSLAEALFVQLEEAFFAGDPRIDGPLKDLLTGREIIIERKNIDPIKAPNFASFVIISNADRPVPIDEGSRRYYPIECSGARANDRNYFAAIHEEMENGGVEAMAWDLLHWSPPGGDWGFLREFPQTAAGDRMIAAGLIPVERFILTWAWQGNTGNAGVRTTDLANDGDSVISTAEIAVAFAEWAEDPSNVTAREKRDLRMDAATIGAKLKAMLPLVEKVHGEKGNGRLFPAQGRVVEMLRMHRNGGYSAFLDWLAEEDG